jgi:multidrug efflux pump subunit AcrA (membrane-fusion protein)
MYFYTQAKQERDAQQAQAQIEAIERQQKMDKTDAEIRKIEADIAKGHIITLGEGSMLYDLRTGETFKNPKTYAPDRGASGVTGGKISTTQYSTLQAGGWTASEIERIHAGVTEWGIDTVVERERGAGASEARIRAIEQAYGSADRNQFLTKDYLKSLWTDAQLAEAAKAAGFTTGWNKKGDSEAYLTQLESTIAAYRAAGFTDQDILKMMKK